MQTANICHRAGNGRPRTSEQLLNKSRELLHNDPTLSIFAATSIVQLPPTMVLCNLGNGLFLFPYKLHILQGLSKGDKNGWIWGTLFYKARGLFRILIKTCYFSWMHVCITVVAIKSNVGIWVLSDQLHTILWLRTGQMLRNGVPCQNNVWKLLIFSSIGALQTKATDIW